MVGFLSTGCVGTAGGELFDFDAYATGPSDSVSGSPYTFTTGRGYVVTLTRAKLHVGAVYLNRTVPTSVASNTSCFLPGIYVAEVTTGLDVDALLPELQRFPVHGTATTDFARAGEVWLTGGDINVENDSTVILDIAGSAAKDGAQWPFEGTITIGKNRAPVVSDPALPSSKPICKERIVTPIPVRILPKKGGRLVLRVDPSGWFANVDFAQATIDPTNPVYTLHDVSGSGCCSSAPASADAGSNSGPTCAPTTLCDQPSSSLYDGLRSSIGPYTFFWEGP